MPYWPGKTGASMDELAALRQEREQIKDLIIALAQLGRSQSTRMLEVEQRIAVLTAPPPAPSAAPQTPPPTIQVRPRDAAGLHLWTLDATDVHVWAAGRPLCSVDAPITRWRLYEQDLRGWVEICATCWNNAHTMQGTKTP